MSQLDSIEETLNGHRFEVFKLDPIKSLEALNVVKDALAPALGTGLGSVDKVADIGDVLDSPDVGAKLGPVIEKLLTSADFNRQKFLIETFRPVTNVDGKKLGADQFSLVFRGDLPLMFAWLKLCMDGEWGNVGGAITTAIQNVIAQVRPVERSPNTSSPDGPSST